MTTTWLVRCGDGGRHIDDAVSRGIITVDFSAATDVTGLPVEEIATQLEATKTRTATNRLAEMLFAFANDIDTQLALEEQLQAEAGRTEDYAEGVRAFIEKRPPRFKGA